MNHLPSPKGAEVLQVRIPYYGGEYDGGPFMTYLERRATDLASFLNQATSVLQPHTISSEARGLEQESWLEVEFERLIEICTQAKDNVDNDGDDFTAAWAGFLEIADDIKPVRQSSATSKENPSADRETKSEVDKNVVVRQVLKDLAEDAHWKHQRGDIIAAEKCISWYRRVAHLARFVLRPDFELSSDKTQPQTLVLVLRRCSEPMPESILAAEEADEQAHKLCVTLQNWLFFGTLQSTFSKVGIDFQAKDFVESREDGVWLSTRCLVQYIAEWKDSEAKRVEDVEARHARGMEIMSNLQWASKIVAEFERVVPARGIGGSALSFCILLLVCTLQQQASIIYGRGFVLSFTSAYLRRKFLATGWCPNQVAAIESSFMLSWQYYIYLTGANRPDDQSGNPHDHCTVAHCRVNQVSKDTYRLRHVFNDQGIEYETFCPICDIADGYRESAPRRTFFNPDLEKLVQIVKDGGIPLISIYDVNIEQYNNDPKIVRYDPSRMDYVAISHVWSDGLGNPHNNSVNLCQIMMLAKALTQLGAGGMGDGRLYFWLDTICVPLKPASARITAIQSISRVFSQANCDVPSTKLETITRILVSNWARRLWTYSEAMLSNRIAFKFLGEWIDFHDTLEELKNEAIENPTWDFLGALKGVHASVRIPWSCSDTITDLVKDLPELKTAPTLDVAHCLAKIRSLAALARHHGITPEHTRALAFMSLIRGTPWKATSVASDELICIAQLLNMDLIPILKFSSNQIEALKLLLHFQHVFPRSFIFVDANRIKEDGYRWSPSSYISNCVNQSDLENLKVTRELALLSTDGLVFEWPGIIFEVNKPTGLEDSTYPFLFTFPTDVESKDANHAYRVLVQSRKEVPPDKLKASGSDHAIILEAPAALPLQKQTITIGILTTLLRRAPDVCYVRYITRVAVERVELSTSKNPLWSADLLTEQDDLLDHVEVLPPTQAWCLS